MSDDVLVKSQQLGKAIVSEAQKRYEEQRQELFFKEVQRMMQCRDDSARQERHFAASADWYRAKLNALDQGEFRFDEVEGTLIFNDPNFQRANY